MVFEYILVVHNFIIKKYIIVNIIAKIKFVIGPAIDTKQSAFSTVISLL